MKVSAKRKHNICIHNTYKSVADDTRMNRNTIGISVAIVFSTIALVMIIQGIGSNTTPDDTRTEAISAASFSLTDIETGEMIALETYSGEPVVMHVFASWCALCTQTARSISAYNEEEEFNVLLISADSRETDDSLIRFKQEHGHESWKIARLTPEFERAYGVRSLDSKFIIDDQGLIAHSDSRIWRIDDARRLIGESI